MDVQAGVFGHDDQSTGFGIAYLLSSATGIQATLSAFFTTQLRCLSHPKYSSLSRRRDKRCEMRDGPTGAQPTYFI
jgi:hypothetical protein